MIVDMLLNEFVPWQPSNEGSPEYWKTVVKKIGHTVLKDLTNWNGDSLGDILEVEYNLEYVHQPIFAWWNRTKESPSKVPKCRKKVLKCRTKKFLSVIRSSSSSFDAQLPTDAFRYSHEVWIARERSRRKYFCWKSRDLLYWDGNPTSNELILNGLT